MIGYLRTRPITFKAPLLVAILMIAVSGVVSERVLNRLADTQRRHLEDLLDSYLDGLSSSLVPHVLNEDIWGVFDTLERSRELYNALNVVETVVAGSDARVLAATDPAAVPTLSPVPAIYGERVADGELVLSTGDEHAFSLRTLRHQGLEVGTIYATFDISHLIAERREVLMTLLLTNIALTGLLAAFGYFAVKRMVRPMRVLSEHLQHGESDQPRTIPGAELNRESGEMAELFNRYNALVKGQLEREILAMKLAEEERLASLGRLASGMAHEINNPLGGLFNALDTLKRHGAAPQVRATALSILDRGLIGIRDVVAAALSTYRTDRSQRTLKASDLEDLKVLVQPELRRRRLSLDWRNNLPNDTDIVAAPVRQAVLNLLLNACAAAPENGTVRLVADHLDNRCIEIEVCDSGTGLTATTRAFLEGSGDLSPIRAGGGLGLWMVRRLMRESGGSIAVGESPLGGAAIKLVLGAARTAEIQDVA